MLYRFSVENYRSFKDRNELSFIPSSPDAAHVADGDTPIPVLRSAVIYGANASGKSNLIKAMGFARNLILDNSLLSKSNNESFRMNIDNKERPSVFMFQIKVDGELYEYGFAVSFKKTVVMGEWLTLLRVGEEREIFSRDFDEKTGKSEIEFNADYQNGNAGRYETYKEDMENSMGELTLSNLAQKRFEGDRFKNIIDSVYRWFVNLLILFPSNTINLIGAIAKDKEAVNRLYEQYYRFFDIDIDEIKLNKVSRFYIGVPDEIQAQMKVDLNRIGGDSICILHGGSQDFMVKLDENGELQFSEIRFLHKSGDIEVAFTKENESDGTLRLFDLIPVIGKIINEDRVLVVDELDRSLHTILTRKIFEYFYRNSANRKSQLICTTHDIVLLDMSPISNDEIWFVDKKEKQSHLYPLSMYKLTDGDNDLVKKYLIGRFEAIPH